MANSVLGRRDPRSHGEAGPVPAEDPEAEAGLAAGRQKGQQNPPEFERLQPAIQGDLQRLEAEMKECEDSLPPLARDVYFRVVRQRGEDALAAVDGGFCGGCNTQVPLNVQAGSAWRIQASARRAAGCFTCPTTPARR